MDLDKYWEISPVWFEKYVKVYIKKEENRARELDLNNFNLGKYLTFAFHDPKKYPKKPFLQKEEKKKGVMTDEEMKRIMKENTIKLGGKINEPTTD